MWIELHDTLIDHIKLKQLVRILKIKRVLARGHLSTLWLNVLRHATDGCLDDWSPEDLAEFSEWEGDPAVWRAALMECEFLVHAGDSLVICDWEEFAAHLKAAKHKANARDRKRKQRQRQKQHRQAQGDDAPPFVPASADDDVPFTVNAARLAQGQGGSAPELAPAARIESSLDQLTLEPGADLIVTDGHSDVTGTKRDTPAVVMTPFESQPVTVTSRDVTPDLTGPDRTRPDQTRDVTQPQTRFPAFPTDLPPLPTSAAVSGPDVEWQVTVDDRLHRTGSRDTSPMCAEPGCTNPTAKGVRICIEHRDENLSLPDPLEPSTASENFSDDTTSIQWPLRDVGAITRFVDDQKWQKKLSPKQTTMALQLLEIDGITQVEAEYAAAEVDAKELKRQRNAGLFLSIVGQERLKMTSMPKPGSQHAADEKKRIQGKPKIEPPPKPLTLSEEAWRKKVGKLAGDLAKGMDADG